MTTPCPRPHCGGSLVARHVVPYGDGRAQIEWACTLCGRAPEQRRWEPARRSHGPSPGFHKAVNIGHSHTRGADRSIVALAGGPAIEAPASADYQRWKVRRKAGQE